jgi:hypothetical protein
MSDRTHVDGPADPLASLRPEDFDGHTVFADLTPAQRLEALGHMITVVASFKGIATLSQEHPHCRWFESLDQ